MKMSIKTKMFLMYAVISLVIFTCFNVIIVNQIKAYNRRVIKEDMIDLKEKTINYIIKDFDVDNERVMSYNNYGALKNLRYKLSMNFNSQIIIYSNGTIASEYAPCYRSYDFSNISFKKDSNSYDINYFKNKAIVDFPIKYSGVNSKLVIRYFVDYSNMINTEKRIQIALLVLSIFSSIVFVGLSMLSSSRFIKKLFKIKAFTKQIVNNDFNDQLVIKSKDEFEILANDLNDMKHKLHQQITKIKEDRDEIKRISKYKKNFYDNVTHELKTPLTTIMGYSELLITEHNGNDEDLECIQIINSESNRLLDLVQSILDISFYGDKELNNSKEYIYLNAIINNTVQKMSIKAKKYKVTLKCELEANLFVFGNVDAMRSLLINLIDNSIKYNKVNGQVLIKAFHRANNVHIIVEDTGIGIAKDNLKNIFKPFFKEDRLNRVSKSSGLGMAIIDSVVKSHNASISIKSEVNHGTQVNVVFNVMENK